MLFAFTCVVIALGAAADPSKPCEALSIGELDAVASDNGQKAAGAPQKGEKKPAPPDPALIEDLRVAAGGLAISQHFEERFFQQLETSNIRARFDEMCTPVLKWAIIDSAIDTAPADTIHNHADELLRALKQFEDGALPEPDGYSAEAKAGAPKRGTAGQECIAAPEALARASPRATRARARPRSAPRSTPRTARTPSRAASGGATPVRSCDRRAN